MKKILALATCFNRKDKTIKAINSLVSGNRDIDFSFVICDDNSFDGTYEELLKIDNVKVIKGTGSLFWCGGMRKAIDEALRQTDTYDYCMWFNDDVVFFEHSIDKLANKEENVVWVGPTCDDNNELSYGGVIKTSCFRPKYRKVIADTESGLECDTFNANCVLIPWEIFINTGNMDSVYTHQFGDYDYGFMLKSKRIQIKVSNEFIGICNTNSNLGTFNDKTLSIKERLRLKKKSKGGLPANEWFHYLRKNYNMFIALIYSVTPYIRIFII